jgi:rubrerythrin
MSVSAAAPRRELERYRCGTCTYGISVDRLPHRCPMCGSRAWNPEPKPRRGTA